MKPLKRHPDLIQLSQEHHHTLALCVRMLREPNRNHREDIIAHFVDLEKHFSEEETLFAPLWHKLPEPKFRAQFEAEHEKLRQLYRAAEFDNPQWNTEFATLLREHVRFEERELFEQLAQHALPQAA